MPIRCGGEGRGGEGRRGRANLATAASAAALKLNPPPENVPAFDVAPSGECGSNHYLTRAFERAVEHTEKPRTETLNRYPSAWHKGLRSTSESQPQSTAHSPTAAVAALLPTGTDRQAEGTRGNRSSRPKTQGALAADVGVCACQMGANGMLHGSCGLQRVALLRLAQALCSSPCFAAKRCARLSGELPVARA